jgi:hypothetical protein
LLKAQRDTNKARNTVVAAGRELAPRLEAAGEDCSALLAFLHAADAGGGPAAALPLWAPLKVALQRLAIREGLPPAAANLGRKFYGVASWPLYPFGDRPQRLPPPETFGTFSADAAKLWAPSQAGTIEGTPTSGNRVCLDWDGVAVELYFPTDADRATLAAALPGCDLDNPPWHTVQARLVAAGTSADWPNLTAQAVVALLAKTSTPPPRTGQGEGTGADSQGDKPPAPGGAKATKAKQDKPRTKRERLREQRLKFCRPRRAKGEPWESIYRAYRPKYPKDTKASPDNLRLTFERWEGKYTE